MRPSNHRSARRAVVTAMALSAALTLIPRSARAQYSAPDLTTGAVGEKYHIEVSGTLWNPDPLGVISSEQFGLIGSKIDFVSDLAFQKTRFKDLRLVLRPSKKSKFRIQYTPVVYESSTTLKRNIVFNGITFPLNVPINSAFEWKVLRVGYEYDVLYKSRGFVGILLEGRYTQTSARLQSPLSDEFNSRKAPLPALGIVGRAYVLPEVAINVEVSGMKLPAGSVPNIEANYFDWDISGTVNVTNNVGLQAGWRKMTTYLAIKKDTGDVRFQGLWFGAALRY